MTVRWPWLRRLVGLVADVPIRLVAAVLGAAIGLFVTFGTLQRVWYPYWNLANLDSEASIATLFSAAVLWAAALGWLLVAVSARPPSTSLWAWCVILAWLALDEGNAFHEQLERWSGIDWQVLYLPVMAAGAAAWWGVVRRFRTQTRIVVLLVMSAASWAIALTFELVQNWGGSPARSGIYVPTMIAEEALEMIGSAMIIIAAILALRCSIRAASLQGNETGAPVGE